MQIGLVKSMEIRKLEIQDAFDTFGVMKESFSTPWSKEAIENLILSENAVCLGSFEGEVLTGYAFLECVLDEGSLTDIAVHPDYRRRGISQALMEALLKEAKGRNLAFVTLEVRASNTPAINLYRKNGFEDVGRRPSYYTAPTEDALLMTKTF